MKEILALAKENLVQSLPFVLYKKPKKNILKGIFQKDASLNLVKDFKEEGFVFAPFNDNDATILLSPDKVLEHAIDFDANEICSNQKELKPDAEEHRRYKDLVSRAVDAINSNEFRKVVVSRKVEIGFTDAPITLFRKLITTYDNAFCYLWFHPKVGIWLGATPEILVKRSGLNFTTMSLAGTQAYDEKLVKPIWSSKELDEQRLVTAYIKEKLAPITSKLNISPVESIRAGQLWHLRTKISGQMTQDDFGALTTTLHPTPAVCGLPLAASKKFIHDNEGYDRSYYTGYLGELNFKEEKTRNTNKRNTENNAYKTISRSSELYVNLRCLQLKRNKAIVYVGGGITKESDPEKEWQETVHKSHTMLNIM